MKTIVFRTLGGKGIGYGHFYRCLSLAKGITFLEKHVNIIFIINEELIELIENTSFNYIVSNKLNEDLNIIGNMDIDLFILDSYLGSNEYLRKIKRKTKLMLMDDNNDIYDSTIADILYNGNIYAQNLNYLHVKDQIQLLGSKYLIMKEEYWVNKQDEYTSKEGVLVTTGGTDKYGVITRIIDTIKHLDIKINVVIGPGFNDDYIKEIDDKKPENVDLIYKPISLKDYINLSKIVITAGGSTVYEVLSQKSIPIVFSIADNQDLLCAILNRMGIEYIGKYPNIDYTKLKPLLKRVYSDDVDREAELNNLVTGEGTLLVAQEIIGLLDK
ncbi:MAG: hypothetical protein GX231_03875 [Tissierellia bacterium]|nr:hypothetical protein [Tissierellia bacterium]